MNMNARHDMPVSDKSFITFSREPATRIDQVNQECMPLSPTKVAMARAEDGLQQIMYYIQLKLNK